jgi:glycosyltransferase involved in cell wall biosynthesis
MMHVSCLMVTKPGREELAARAIGDFYRQTYPDRDLVVVTTSKAGRKSLQATIRNGMYSSFESDNRALPPFGLAWYEPEAPLGALRNIAMDMTAGDAICQWDDDDRHHPERLAAQVRALETSGCHSCFLSSQLYYFMENEPPCLYVVDWTLAPTAGSGVLIPGTVLCRRADVRYDPSLRTGEDTKFLQDEVKANGRSARIDRPGLYARGWHRGNTTSHAKAHCNVRDRGWRRRKIEERLDELRDDIRALDLPHDRVQLRVANENIHMEFIGNSEITVVLKS